MCKCCEIESNGNMANESIFEIDYDFGQLGQNLLTASIWRNMDGTDVLNIGFAESDHEIAINFCPMCGRKLKGVEEDV